MTKKSNGEAKAAEERMNEDERNRLHCSIAQYLDLNGFSKSLKKFLEEAQLQKDSLKNASLNLEEIHLKYLEARNCAAKVFGNQEEQDSKHTKGAITDAVPSSKGKSKEKKKGKKNSDSVECAEEKAPADGNITKEKLDVANTKSKDRRGNMSVSESLADDLKSVEGAKKEKESKKRKRQASEKNDSKPVDGKTVEESKRRKTEGLEKSEGDEESMKKSADLASDEHSGEELKGEGGRLGPEASMKTPNKELTEQENGNLGNDEQKSALQKSSKKQHETSSEPKTVNAFRRVKADEVEFVDERLQDNSYWAKDGAESGYGAKAQEILGQVRGRGFRHEKTKKKRGTYRGGQIDLQSHSIKFNYSDEDE